MLHFLLLIFVVYGELSLEEAFQNVEKRRLSQVSKRRKRKSPKFEADELNHLKTLNAEQLQKKANEPEGIILPGQYSFSSCF